VLPFSGHYYFTKLLMPTLLSTAKTSGVPARIVNVASTGVLMTGGLNFDTFRENQVRKKVGTQALYNQSKFGNIVVALEFARRYGDQGIVSTSLNPGTIDTDLPRHLDSFILKIFLVRSASKGGGAFGLWLNMLGIYKTFG
jgi:retinol dehydrogenase 12